MRILKIKKYHLYWIATPGNTVMTTRQDIMFSSYHSLAIEYFKYKIANKISPI